MTIAHQSFDHIQFIVVDLFCGAGGTTLGFEKSGVAKVVAAVNHDPEAIESHWRNHPEVKHFEEDIRTLELKPLGRHVKMCRSLYPNARLILWASLECTNFSKAKGGMPRDADSRTLADHLHRYVELLRPDFVLIENVVEFMAWGPLDENGKPLSRKNGSDWMKWKQAMCAHGYLDDWRELNAADYGARQSRNRLFGQFFRPGNKLQWPEPTHAKNPEKEQGLFPTLKKHKACRPCFDLEEKGTSIFTPGRIRSERTFERIYEGLVKHVAGMKKSEFITKYYSGNPKHKSASLDGPAPTVKTIDGSALVSVDFVMHYNSTDANSGETRSTASLDEPARTVTTQRTPQLVSCFLHNYHSSGHNTHSLENAAPTVVCADLQSLVFIDRQFSQGTKHQSVDEPHGALTTVPKSNLVQVMLMSTNFDNGCSSVEDPSPTITANRKWHYLLSPQYMNAGGSLDKPCFTIIARQDKMPAQLVTVEGGTMGIGLYEDDSPTVRRIKEFMAIYGICDIKMRMLKVVELKRLQGFPDDYVLLGNQSEQKKFIGNAVHPDPVQAWVLANVSAAVKEAIA